MRLENLCKKTLGIFHDIDVRKIFRYVIEHKDLTKVNFPEKIDTIFGIKGKECYHAIFLEVLYESYTMYCIRESDKKRFSVISNRKLEKEIDKLLPDDDKKLKRLEHDLSFVPIGYDIVDGKVERLLIIYKN